MILMMLTIITMTKSSIIIQTMITEARSRSEEQVEKKNCSDDINSDILIL